MKVLTIISKLEVGGIEKTLLACMPHLIANGVEMTILRSTGGGLDDEYRSLGVKLIDFGTHKKPFRDAKFLKRVLSESKYDVVHSRYGHTSGLFAKVCHNMGVPFIVSIHNERAMFRNNWIGKPILGKIRTLYLNYHKKLTLKYATKIIGHSKTNLRYFADVNKGLASNNQFCILYNGVDFSKLDNYPELDKDEQSTLDKFVDDSNKVFIHIGSFKEQKNHLFLIDVFKKIEPEINNYRLILIGDGALLKCVKSYVNDLNLENHVFFTGIQSNIGPYLKKSDIFLFPSLYEGFGNVLIEAQYAKVPVVASAIAPHFEAVEKGYHQFMFDPVNTSDAVQKVNMMIISDVDIYIERAKLFASDFSVINMVNNMLKIYKRALDGWNNK